MSDLDDYYASMSLEDQLGNALGVALMLMHSNTWGNRDMARLETVLKKWTDKTFTDNNSINEET
jgi:hypothetical protein